MAIDSTIDKFVGRDLSSWLACFDVLDSRLACLNKSYHISLQCAFSIRIMFNRVLFDDTCMGVFETLLSVFLEFDFHLSLCFMEFNLS